MDIFQQFPQKCCARIMLLRGQRRWSQFSNAPNVMWWHTKRRFEGWAKRGRCKNNQTNGKMKSMNTRTAGVYEQVSEEFAHKIRYSWKIPNDIHAWYTVQLNSASRRKQLPRPGTRKMHKKPPPAYNNRNRRRMGPRQRHKGDIKKKCAEWASAAAPNAMAIFKIRFQSAGQKACEWMIIYSILLHPYV